LLQQQYKQYNVEKTEAEAAAEISNTFKRWKSAPTPPSRLTSVEYVQDLQEPGVNEKGMGADEGRRATGELLPGQFELDAIKTESTMGDFQALKEKFRARPRASLKLHDRVMPVLRQDRVNSVDSENEDIEPEFVMSPTKRDHSKKISQMPPKSPGGPRIRLEKDNFSDESDYSDEDNQFFPDNDQVSRRHSESVRQMPPNRSGGPRLRVEVSMDEDDDDMTSSGASSSTPSSHSSSIRQLPPRYKGGPMIRLDVEDSDEDDYDDASGSTPNTPNAPLHTFSFN
jgi:hypothetical protein